jgi:hypothetical protein
MLPSLPSIPTDSLHRFLAITGLLLMIVPTLYLTNKADSVREEVIHLKAERKILDIQSEIITKRRRNLYVRVFGRDVTGYSKGSLQLVKDSLIKLNKMVDITPDSAEVERKKVDKLTTDIKIANVHLDEKDEIIKFNLIRIDSYKFISKIFFFIGLAMASFGFIRWYNKEKS